MEMANQRGLSKSMEIAKHGYGRTGRQQSMEMAEHGDGKAWRWQIMEIAKRGMAQQGDDQQSKEMAQQGDDQPVSYTHLTLPTSVYV